MFQPAVESVRIAYTDYRKGQIEYLTRTVLTDGDEMKGLLAVEDIHDLWMIMVVDKLQQA